MATELDKNEEDFTVTLNPGEGIWLSVTDNKGDKVVLRVGCDRLTGMFKAQAFNPGEEDTVPVEEFRIDF